MKNVPENVFVHIVGLSGSGKTTITEKLAKHPSIAIINTDDIYVDIITKFLSEKKYAQNFSSQKKFDRMMNRDFPKLARSIVLEKYNTAQRQNKLVVIDGFLNKMFFAKKFFDNKHILGFYLDTGPDEIFRRRYNRSYSLMCAKCHDIKKLFRTEKNPLRIQLELDKIGMNKYFMELADITAMNSDERKKWKKIGYNINSDQTTIAGEILRHAEKKNESKPLP